MPEATTAPNIPAELLLAIFDYLRPHDLAQVCKSNSYLRKLARPLFYRYATLTKFGWTFPGARHPHPFLEVPGSLKRLSDKELGHIASNLREVYIPAHPASDCAMFRNLRPKEVKLRAITLRVESGVRTLKNLSSVDCRDAFPHIDTCPAPAEDQYGLLQPCKSFRAYSLHDDNDDLCHFLRAIATMKPEKAVIRDAIMTENTFVSPVLRPVKPSNEFITVLDSRDIWKDTNCGLKCPQLDAALIPFWATTLITIVLWTGHPNVPWVPPCSPDDHTCEPKVARVTESFGVDGLRPQCFFMADLWADIGDQVSLRYPFKCRKLRIVNAPAIVETYVDASGNRIEKRRASIASIEHTIRAHAVNDVELEKHMWKGGIEFLTMEGWIALGEWEDVFTYKEMAPFLTDNAFLGSNA